MRIERATHKAVRHACLHFHYAKRLPAQPMIGYNVFEGGQWCGVVVFNSGIRNIESPYNLKQGQVAELCRVALNGKQSATSKAVSRAVKIFKKSNPLVKMLVSYADSDEGHNGTIYQAMNWHFTGSHKTGDKFVDPKTGKDIHSRAHSPTGKRKQFGVMKRVLKTQDLIRIKKGDKHKYIYPLHKSMTPLCKSLAQPYPKKQAQEVNEDKRPASSRETGGSSPTLALKNLETN